MTGGKTRKTGSGGRCQVPMLLALNALLILYSVTGILSKLAAGQPFPSWRFIAAYAVMILMLGMYAIGWQQILKRMPLTTAFANKAVTIAWGVVWGAVIFGERVTLPMVLGAAMAILGVVLFSFSDAAEPAVASEEKDIA